MILPSYFLKNEYRLFIRFVKKFLIDGHLDFIFQVLCFCKVFNQRDCKKTNENHTLVGCRHPLEKHVEEKEHHS